MLLYIINQYNIVKQLSSKLKKKSFTGEFHQTFKEKSTSTLLKLFQNTSEEGMFLNSFYEASITLIAKQGKNTTQKRKLQANITDEHRHKIP